MIYFKRNLTNYLFYGIIFLISSCENDKFENIAELHDFSAIVVNDTVPSEVLLVYHITVQGEGVYDLVYPGAYVEIQGEIQQSDSTQLFVVRGEKTTSIDTLISPLYYLSPGNYEVTMKLNETSITDSFTLYGRY